MKITFEFEVSQNVTKKAQEIYRNMDIMNDADEELRDKFNEELQKLALEVIQNNTEELSYILMTVL